MTQNKLPTRCHCTRELHFIRHTTTARYVQKEGRCNCPPSSHREKHTRLTEYHGIHTDKLAPASIRLFKLYISLYHRSIFLLYALILYHTTLQMGELLCGEKKKVHAVFKDVGGAHGPPHARSVRALWILPHVSATTVIIIVTRRQHLYSTCLFFTDTKNSTRHPPPPSC